MGTGGAALTTDLEPPPPLSVIVMEDIWATLGASQDIGTIISRCLI